MPYAVQLKIYEAYARTSTCSGTGRPRSGTRSLIRAPRSSGPRSSSNLVVRRDAKHLRELEAQGLLNPDVDNGKLPPREAREAARARSGRGLVRERRGAAENEPRRRSSSSPQQQQQQQQQQQRSSSRNSSSSSSKGSLCPPLSAGTSSSRTITAMPVVLPQTRTPTRRR